MRIDPDVEIIAAFMQRNFPTSKLVALARGISSVAPAVWGHYAAEPPVAPLTLTPSDGGPHTQPDAT